MTLDERIRMLFGAAALTVGIAVGAQTADASDFYAKRGPPQVGVYHRVADPNFRSVELADRMSEYGKIQRSLRWQNITSAVEDAYGIPRSTLLGMMCVESLGDPTQPNMSGDGGLGLIHMQPLLADAYGLEMITNSTKLRDFAQGRKIEQIIAKERGNLNALIPYDDRFHPIKSIDAAGRILADHYRDTHDWNAALRRYAGRSSYAPKVQRFRKLLNDRTYMSGIERDFNTRNAGKKVGSHALTFPYYVSTFQSMNANFGLPEYLKRHQRSHPPQKRPGRRGH